MPHIIKNLVEQGSTSTGATTIVPTIDPKAPFRAFADVMTDGATTELMVVNIDRRNEWQAAVYRYAAGVLTFVRLIASSTGSQVNFGAGVKRVYMASLAERTQWVTPPKNGLPVAFQSWRRGTSIGDDQYRRVPAAEGTTFASVGADGNFADIAVMRQNGNAPTGLGVGAEMQLAGSSPAEGSSNVICNLYPFQCAQWRGIDQLTFQFYAWRGAGYAGPFEVTILGSSEAAQPILRPDGSFTSGSYEIAKGAFDLGTDYPDPSDVFSITGPVPAEMMQVAVRWSAPWAGSTPGTTCTVAFTANTLFAGPPRQIVPEADPNAIALAAMYYSSSYPIGINPGSNPLHPGAIRLRAVQTDTTPRYGGEFPGRSFDMIAAPTIIVRSPQTGADAKAWNKTRKVDFDVSIVDGATSGLAVQASRPASNGAALTVTGATRSGDVATVTLSGAHGMEKGDPFVLASLSPALWNTPSGSYDRVADGSSGSTVKLEMKRDPGTYTSGGTLTRHHNTIGQSDELLVHAYAETIW